MKKAWFLFFAIWPFVLFAAAITIMFGTRFGPPQWFITAWIAGTAVFAVGWVSFLWDVWHNSRVPPDKRALWTAVLVLGGPYALPFYFWFYVR